MKVVLYMEIATNGYIAKNDNDTTWISKEAWESYEKMMKSADVIIIGRKTYELMPEDEFYTKPQYVVITTKKPKEIKTKNITFTNDNPQQVIANLKNQGNKVVCISGGSQINSLFMKNSLIDEIYLDIEPIIFGKGIQLFNPAEFEFKLELIETKHLNKNTIQLHYKVIK